MIELPKHIYFNGTVIFDVNGNNDLITSNIMKMLKQKRIPIVVLDKSNNYMLCKINYVLSNDKIISNILELIYLGLDFKGFSQIIEIILFEQFRCITQLANGVSLSILKHDNPKSDKEIRKSWLIPIKAIDLKLKEKKRIFSEVPEIIYEGNYFELPCLRILLTIGAQKGKRNYGGKIIAFASKCNNITIKEAYEVGQHYYDRTKTKGFEFLEIKKWINWVYKLNDVKWYCKFSREIDICSRYKCWKHKENIQYMKRLKGNY